MQIFHKRNVSILVFSLLIIISTISFTFFTNQSQGQKIINVSGDVSRWYDSFSELEKDADVIVEVEIENIDTILFSDVVFSVSSAKVTNVLKGEYTEKTINILETGGIYKGQEYVFEENPVSKKNQKQLLYLVRYVGPIHDDAYVILGVYQGKFNIDKNNKLIPSYGVSSGLKSTSEVSELY